MPEQPSDMGAHLGYWLRYVSNHVSHAFALKVEAKGATVAEWAVMRSLYGGGPTAPSEVAARIGLTRGAISKLADRLVAKGFAERTQSETDRRYQALALTKKGRALVPVLAALADRNDAEFFGHMTKAERKALEEAMKDLVRRHGLRSMPVD